MILFFSMMILFVLKENNIIIDIHFIGVNDGKMSSRTAKILAINYHYPTRTIYQNENIINILDFYDLVT